MNKLEELRTKKKNSHREAVVRESKHSMPKAS